MPVRLRPALSCGLVVVAGAAPLVVASAAQAHSGLVSSDPASGAVLAAAPGTVQLRFGGPLAPRGLVTVVGPDGQAQQGRAAVSGDVVDQALRPGAEPGRYRVTYRVAGADGHPVTGELHFDVTAGSGPAPPADAGPEPLRPTLGVGLALGAGGVVVAGAGWVGRRRAAQAG